MAKLRKRMSISMTVDIPEGVAIGELKRYVKKALASWGGGGDWDEPLYDGVIARDIEVVRGYKLVRSRR